MTFSSRTATPVSLIELIALTENEKSQFSGVGLVGWHGPNADALRTGCGLALNQETRQAPSDCPFGADAPAQ